MSTEEEASPMLLEMARVGSEDGMRKKLESGELSDSIIRKTSTTATGTSEDNIENGSDTESEDSLAAEYAVGTDIPSTWDMSNDPVEDNCEDQATIFGYRLTRFFCGLLRARRLGHMALLHYQQVDSKQKFCSFFSYRSYNRCIKWNSTAHPSDNDDHSVHRTTTRRNIPQASSGANCNDEPRTKLICIMGPFWPFALLVTYPLILLCSIAVALTFLPGKSIFVIIVWSLAVLALLIALSCTACSDPGILRRYRTAPNSSWRWNDQARTFRPPGAVYDEDLGLVVEGFDHVCPWTGTGIGANNINAFHAFVTILCICIILDILLLLQVLP
mmetsp:Transcript_9489/g.13130  ORF Transcript_9489/g.13130 Transcript_9489/m.13130 type:complete len:330 (+) Transcript_9489:37-1026(+)